MDRLDRDRLSQILADRLQLKILDEEMSPGSRLPTEVDLMEQYDVSRTVVREAAAILASRGLVDVRPRRGMTVRRADPRTMAAPLMALLKSNRVLPTQLIEVRQQLEKAIARTAAIHRTVEDLANLEACVWAAERVGSNQVEAARLDMQFHELLAEATHNPFYIVVTSPVTALLREMYEESFGYLALQSETNTEHRLILAAVAAGDAVAAERAIDAHLDRVSNSIKQIVDWSLAGGGNARTDH